MLGWTREEIVDKTFVDLVPATDVERLKQTKRRLLNSETLESEWSLQCKDGSYLPVEKSARILPDGRWQGFARDIRERRQVETKLRQTAIVFENTMDGVGHRCRGKDRASQPFLYHDQRLSGR